MSLFITSLNSGSNGNCYYVSNGNDAVLVDAGISCKETEKRMERLGLSMKSVKALFISHEHSDHIRGVEVISKKYQLPVYITPATLERSRLKIQQQLVCLFHNQTAISIGNLTVKPFAKRHDAADPYSFVVSGNSINIGVFTDIGFCCENVIEHFKQCHAVFLEANYDSEMLETGMYPYYLKKRITSGHGHLSNDQSLELFKTYRSNTLSHLILSHLSRENNSPSLVKKLFEEHAASTQIIVASREYETDVYEIKDPMPASAALTEERARVYLNHGQQALF
ncbi:MAG: MBL fold metallo-hydrolase [Bacteroidota bacterium]